MSKQIRIYLTVDEETRSLLEEWAEQEDRNITNLATRLVKQAMRDAIARGEFKPQKDRLQETESLAIAYIQAVANAGTIGLLDLQKLADELQVPSDRLAEILKQSKGKVQNGNNH